MEAQQQLERIAATLNQGGDSPKVAVRDFLAWFGAKRRGMWIVRTIRDELAAANLQTYPDFEWEWIDAPIEFRYVGSNIWSLIPPKLSMARS